MVNPEPLDPVYYFRLKYLTYVHCTTWRAFKNSNHSSRFIDMYINNPRYIYAYTMDSHAAMHWSSGNFPFFQISKRVNTLGSRGPHTKPVYSFVQKVLFIH